MRDPAIIIPPPVGRNDALGGEGFSLLVFSTVTLIH